MTKYRAIDLLGLNIAHSEFPEQQGGLMICGYEWGFSKKDEETDAREGERQIAREAECTYADKWTRYGEPARSWRYDNRLKRWFAQWGSPLKEENPGAFEKSIIQTNWCDSQNPNMNGDYSRLYADGQIDNFLAHIEYFRPHMILFMGIQQAYALNNPSTLARFEALVGPCSAVLDLSQKPFDGRRFRIGFQSFERCDAVFLPHPSGSQGLSDNYIALFSAQIAPIMQNYRQQRGF